MAPSPIRLGSWKPVTPAEVAEIFSSCQAPWWIAGGYAIELAAGRPIHGHVDIDVLILRRDQLAVQQALPGWQWQAADPPGSLRPWRLGEYLPVGVHDIWCRPGPSEPWRIQVMLDEASRNYWVSRRDERIRRPITSIGLVTARGIPWPRRSSCFIRPRTGDAKTRLTLPRSCRYSPSLKGSGSPTRSASCTARVNGHGEIRVGGRVISWLAAIRNPVWWPCDLPAAG